MPDDYGKLSEQEQLDIEIWLSTRWTRRECPCCGVNEWIPADHILIDTTYSGVFGPSTPVTTLIHRMLTVVPYVARFCGNCGYTVRFNRAMMDLPESGKGPTPGGGPKGVSTSG